MTKWVQERHIEIESSESNRQGQTREWLGSRETSFWYTLKHQSVSSGHKLHLLEALVSVHCINIDERNNSKHLGSKRSQDLTVCATCQNKKTMRPSPPYINRNSHAFTFFSFTPSNILSVFIDNNLILIL